MNSTEIFDKVYFEDSYKEQFAALRNRYHARTQEALRGRKVDHAPVSNVEEIYDLHNTPDGGVYLTTVDFVDYFNRRFGDNDRIGAMRRSLMHATRKAEMCQKTKKKEKSAAPVKEGKVFQPARTASHRFSLLHAVFAVMLALSIAFLGGSTILLDRTQDRVMALEEEVAMLEATRGVVRVGGYDGSGIETVEEYPDFSGEDSVEVYPAEKNGGVEMRALLDALASLGE